MKKRWTVREYLIDRAKREYDILSDETAGALAEAWIKQTQILSGDDYLDEYPEKLQIRIGKLYGKCLEGIGDFAEVLYEAARH